MDEGSNHGAKPLFSSGASNVNGSTGANVTADQTNVTSPTAHFENLSFQTQQSPETTLSFAGISKTGFKITHQQQQEQGTTQQQTQEFKPVILQQQTQQLQPQQSTPQLFQHQMQQATQEFKPVISGQQQTQQQQQQVWHFSVWIFKTK